MIAKRTLIKDLMLMNNKANLMKLTMLKKEIWKTREEMTRKAQDNKNNRTPKIPRRLGSLIYQMTFSLMKRETKKMMVSYISFVFVLLLLFFKHHSCASSKFKTGSLKLQQTSTNSYLARSSP